MIQYPTMTKALKIIFIALAITLLTAGVSLTDPYGDLLDKAMSSLRSGDPDSALSYISQINNLGLEGGTELAQFIAGQCYVKKGDDAEAVKYFLLAANGADFILKDYAIYSLARIYDRTGRKDLAAKAYERVALEHPNSSLAPECLMIMARSAAADGDHKGAVEIFDTIIQAPEEDGMIAEAKFLKARSLEALRRWSDAAKSYYSILFYHPGSTYKPAASKRIAELVKTKKIPYPTATRGERFDRAMSYFDRKDYASASIELLNFLKSYPYGEYSSKARLYLGISEYKRKRYKNASYHLTKVIAAGGTDAAEAQYNLSFVYGMWRNLNGALASLRKVVNNYPRSAFADDAAYYIGYYYDINGYSTQAIREYLALPDKYPKSPWAVDALWRVGKIRYFSGNYEYAYRNFARAADEMPVAAMTEHCVFWKGMAALKLGNRDEAKEAFLRLVKEFDHSFQAYQARERLKYLGVSDNEIEFAESAALSDVMDDNDFEALESDLADNQTYNDDLKSHVRKYQTLMSMGFYDHAAGESKYLMAKSPDEERNSAKVLYFLAVQNNGDFRAPIGFAESNYLEALRDKDLSFTDLKMWKLAYPRGFWDLVVKYSVQYNIDPYLALAVIREESRFNPSIVSWARAHGLMQIIPSTGRGIARLIGMRPYNLYMLFDPETNIKMGCYYLSSLMKRFDNNPYYVLAGYNGGPVRVQKWISNWQKAKGYDIDIDEFVEAIPIYETRRYVKKVMNSYNEYKRIYETPSAPPATQG